MSADSFSETDTRFVPWWSFTKTCLSAAALVLVAQNKLKLDEPLAGEEYSLRQLLQHTSGLPDYGELESYHAAVKNREVAWTEEILNRSMQNLNFVKPGTTWKYSNFGYLQVKKLVERVTGQNVEVALNELAFKPLKIEHVRLATTADMETVGLTGYDPRWVYHGLLVGSVGSAVKFLHRLMDNELLSSSMLNEMLTPHLLDVPPDNRPWMSPAYGLGLIIASDSPAGKAYGHTGQGPGSTFAAYHFPDIDKPTTAAVFENADDQAEVENELIKLVV